MTQRTPSLAVLLAVALSLVTLVPAQADPPSVTGITVSRATIYPRVATAKHPATTTVTVTADDPGTIDHVEIRNTGGTSVYNAFPGSPTFSWNGRDGAGDIVPAGTYTLVAVSVTDEDAAETATVTVSGLRLIRKTFTRTVTAAGSLVDRFVGRCSTLRKPSKRGWKGSLGFYANAKCKKQTWNASAVSTAHVTRLPVAEQYRDIRVNTYGGAAKGHGRSRGLVRYFKLKGMGDPVGLFIGSRVANHPGRLSSTNGLVSSDRYVAWGFATAFKSRYDVKSFTVVVHYDVVG